MTKQLYFVERRAYVLASSELEAEVIDTGLGDTVEVSKASTVDSDWWDSIPFGGDDDRTCGQILTESKASE